MRGNHLIFFLPQITFTAQGELHNRIGMQEHSHSRRTDIEISNSCNLGKMHETPKIYVANITINMHPSRTLLVLHI